MKVRLFTFLLLLLSLHIGRAQTENILLTGEIVNRQNDAPPSIEVCLCDWFNHTVRTNVLIEANGSFRSRLRFTVGHTFAIKYRDTFYAYAAPGDSLHLVIDDRTQAVAFSGDHDALARLYYCYGQDISPFVNDQIRKFTDDTLPLDQQMKFFTGIYRLVEDSIAAYCHRQDIGDHERKLLNTEALYSLANFAAEYRGRNKEEQLAFFTHPLFRLENRDNLNSLLMYAVHLGWYKGNLCRQDSVLQHLQKADRQTAAQQRELELILSCPKSLSRDVMLGSIFNNKQSVSLPNVSEFVLPEAWQMLADQQENIVCLDTAYISFDCSTDSIIYYDKTEGKPTCTPIGSNDFFAYLRAKHPGKAIYVDIYSSWCGPCRREREIAPDFYRRYAGQNIVFVNLCLDSNRKEWLKQLEGKDEGGEYYWFDENTSRQFEGLINLPGFPTHMLISPDGHFITRNAPGLLKKHELSKLLDSILQPNH